MHDTALHVTSLAALTQRVQLHLRRHCGCERMAGPCVTCEVRLEGLAALDAFADVCEQLLVVEDQLDAAVRLLDARMDGQGDCYECADLRVEAEELCS